jgi:2-amino-4-hydroxy-6-hydroxymethyldihydropteridine diphosphokinase
MESHIVYLSVGSNLGAKLDNCRQGIAALTADPQTELLAQSPYYTTEPVDYPDQDWFVNGVVKIATALPPMDLLERLLSIQKNAGRTTDKIRFGPRILDLDILLYDDLVMQSAQLLLPHPRMHKRRFVLQPICDINPTIVHPTLGRTVADLLGDLDESQQRMTLHPCEL